MLSRRPGRRSRNPIMPTENGTAPGFASSERLCAVATTTVACGCTGGLAALDGADADGRGADRRRGLARWAQVPSDGAWFVSSAVVLSDEVAVGRRDGNNRGVMTSTSAINTSARRVRLSILGKAVLRELGRTRQGGTGGTGQFCATRANRREWRHVVRAPQSRMPNSLDNSGRTPARSATA